MEKDKKIIISTPSAAKLLTPKERNNNHIVSTQYKSIIKVFLERDIKKVVVYDITKNNNYRNLEKIPITDHINKTGINPLIGSSIVLKNKFIDITKLYNTSSTEETITTCYGNFFLENLALPTLNQRTFPSTYLCNIAVLCKALGATNIKGVLINSTKLIN